MVKVFKNFHHNCVLHMNSSGKNGPEFFFEVGVNWYFDRAVENCEYEALNHMEALVNLALFNLITKVPGAEPFVALIEAAIENGDLTAELAYYNPPIDFEPEYPKLKKLNDIIYV